MKKLIKCEACEKEISVTAKACPYCGELSKTSKRMQTAKGLMGLGVLCIIGIPCLFVVVAIIVAVLK